MADGQVLELLRDMLRGLETQLAEIRTNQRGISDQLARLSDSADKTHSDIYDRLRELEIARAPAQSTQTESMLSKIGTYWKFAWPVLVVFAVLWKDATPNTKQRAWSGAAQAVGLNIPQQDAESGASTQSRWHAQPSTTWAASPGHPR